MKETLYQKLRASELYTQEELYWLLDNIGNPEADIRDQLVYASFCHALLDGLVTVKDFNWLAEQIMVQNLLFYQIEETGIPTLTRSFTALLAALLIGLDGEEDSPYTASLSQRQKKYLFQQSLNYLKVEKDYTGWSDSYGWVHAFAHGADFLLYASQHPEFPESFATIWQSIVTVFKHQSSIFNANEEKRLAVVVSQLVLQEKATQEDLLACLSNTVFPKTTPKEYLRWINYQNFLLTIYMDLNQNGLLSQELKDNIQAICSH